MRVLFTKNHHVPVAERSRRMYKRGREYEIAEDTGKEAIDTRRAKAVAEVRNDGKSAKPTSSA
jgi:hypothetical protein